MVERSEWGIWHLFDAQVDRTPDAPAVVCADNRLTYQELHRQAGSLAGHLRALGVRPEVAVGVCLDRAGAAAPVAALVGLLGTLAAGGVYVPLDSAAPAARLAFMLQDAAVAVLLTHQPVLARLPTHAAQIMALDPGWETRLAPTAAPTAPALHTDQRAYIIYTSGSTGRPKGVPMRHRNVLPLLRWLHDYFQLGPHTRVLQNLSPCFDFGFLEVVTTLLAGGTLYYPDLPALSRYDEYLRRHGINTLHTTPAFFQVMIALGGQFETLELLHLGGEALTAGLVRRFAQALHPHCAIYNGYGPTETGINCAIYRVDRDRDLSAAVADTAPIPIGQASALNSLYILDGQGGHPLGPAPEGTPGELYVGGPALADGYLHRPDLTAERFVPNLFGAGCPPGPGARLYRTGDRVRRRADGQITFLGRVDQQVKLRGFRIEPGEIEAVLGRHPAVREAVVLARQDGHDDPRLVAYLIARAAPLPVAELRRFAQEQLPDYMVPAAFVWCAAWPLTANGKVDRQALPPPDDFGFSSLDFGALEESYPKSKIENPKFPGTPAEEVLAGLWATLLGREQVGPEADFFALGGHSLLAARLLAQVRAVFGVELPLRAVFEAPTVAGLAARIAAHRRDADRDAAPPDAGPQPRQGALAPTGGPGVGLSYMQEQVWFLQQLEPASRAYYFQAALRFSGPLNIAALEQSLSTIVERHAILRTTFPAVDGRPQAVIHPPTPVSALWALPVVDLPPGAPAEQDTAAQAAIDAALQQPFDLTRLPLVRWRLLRYGPEDHLLLHIEHHLLHDGWSFNVFLRELRDLYTGFASGPAATLPELPIQYADYAAWQREWLAGPVAAGQRAYWQARLAGAIPPLALPVSRPRPAVQTYRGAAPQFELSPALAAALRALSRQEGVTLFITMFAAFLVLLHRYSGQTDLCVGTAVGNRRWPQTEPLLGMFVNTVALRADLAGNPTFRDLLTQLLPAALAAYDHQDLPFPQVVEAVQPARDPRYSPLYQALFSFHDAPLVDLDFPGLQVQLTDLISNGSAKVDLAIVAIPRVEQKVGVGAAPLPSPAPRRAGITLIWEYNSDLFDAPTIARMVRHYERLLESIVAHPDARIAALPFLTAADERRLAAGRDRAAAPPPPAAIAGADRDGPAAPRTPVEEFLAGIWGTVLRRGPADGPVGVHDDFFALGGHSLLAAQVVSRLRDGLQIELPLRRVFEQPTIAALAPEVEALLLAGED